MIVGGKQDQDSAIVALATYFHPVKQANGVVVDIRAIQRLYGDDCNLRVSLLIHQQTVLIDCLHGGRRKDIGVVADIVGRFRQIFYLFRARPGSRTKQK